MSGPVNAIEGDITLPTDLPQTEVPDEVLQDELKLAKYSKTAEFKRLKDFMEARVSFYQNYYPDGRPIKDVTMSPEELAVHWKAANIVITEFKNVLSEYARAAEAVKNANQ